MKLEALLAHAATIQVDGPRDIDIADIAYDSRLVKPGTLFVALKGEKVDGAVFIEKAVAAGASAIVSEAGAVRAAMGDAVRQVLDVGRRHGLAAEVDDTRNSAHD